MRVDNDLKPTVIQCDIHGANGLAFSADRRWMYTSDTPNAVIYRTPLDEQGEPAGAKSFRRFLPGEGIPDGRRLTWRDVTGAQCLTAGGSPVSPQGEELESYPMPVRCPTMVCFGGADMKTLYITTTRENMEDDELAQYPLSGAIFTLPVAVAGMKKLPFRER